MEVNSIAAWCRQKYMLQIDTGKRLRHPRNEQQQLSSPGEGRKLLGGHCECSENGPFGCVIISAFVVEPQTQPQNASSDHMEWECMLNFSLDYLHTRYV